MSNNAKIRSEIRKKRRALSQRQLNIASEQLAENLIQSKYFRNSQNIACYLATEGEIDLMPFIEACWFQNKNIFLPVLQPRNHHPLWFIPFTQQTPLIANRYGIYEPEHDRIERAKKIVSLDCIFVPLVAFDLNGNRMGMGAGYYDRSLNMLKTRQHWLKPSLIGVGHAFQQANTIEVNHWDVQMHFIATDKAIYRVKK